MPERNAFLMEDGDTLELSAGGARRGERVRAGRIMVSGDARNFAPMPNAMEVARFQQTGK